MANGMIQKAEGRGQRADVCVPQRGAFVKGAATPRQRFCSLSSVLCLLLSIPCAAEDLPDPTRPPASIGAPVTTAGTEVIPTGLQTVIISKNRRTAIIDGETVELGGKHGDAKLIAIHEGSVVLQGAQGRRVLTLFPDVKMTAAKKEMETDRKAKVKPQVPKSKHGAAQPTAAQEGAMQPKGKRAGQTLPEEKK